MNERSVTGRQTNNAVYIYNRKQAGKPLHDWSYKKSPVTKVTGKSNRYSKNRFAFSTANAWYRSAFFRLIRASLCFRLGDAGRVFHVPRRRARFFRVLSTVPGSPAAGSASAGLESTRKQVGRLPVPVRWNARRTVPVQTGRNCHY